MTPSTISRRLAAVLIADVVGYSRLMERNETGTHTRLRAVRVEVTDPAIKANDGRIVRTVGDGLLLSRMVRRAEKPGVRRMKKVQYKARPTEKEVEKAIWGKSIEEYRASLPPRKLSRPQRLQLRDGLERVFEGIYTHLPLKRARYGFDPVQRLRILRTQVDVLRRDEEFNAELSDIFAQLRDWHTGYERPDAAGSVATLPFLIEMFGDESRPRYIVTSVGPGMTESPFTRGDEVETWNRVPIDRVVHPATAALDAPAGPIA